MMANDYNYYDIYNYSCYYIDIFCITAIVYILCILLFHLVYHNNDYLPLIFILYFLSLHDCSHS